MKKCMLDTNICIYLMKEQPQIIADKFKLYRRGEVVVSSVTWVELCCGLNVHNSEEEMDSLLSRIEAVPFDTKAATMFGELYQSFPNRKNSFDRMIAAHAIGLNLTLVTNNTDDFEQYQVKGLRLENWTL